MIKTINILGSSGSIGTQAAQVAKHLGLSVRAISVGSNTDIAKKQIIELSPELCAVSDENAGQKLAREFSGSKTKIIYGDDAASFAALFDADATVMAISGFAALGPSLAAVKHSGRIALANKETLVAAGDFFKAAAREAGCEIIPVDSEHSAIFQSLAGNSHGDVKRLILTCSGGSFYGKTAKELESVTLEDALAHPTWNMGKKITVDCATLMNKGLEVIEAMHLFDLPAEKIDVVIHRESIIHSMVEYSDNAVIAQLGSHDMRLPIQYALTYPKRTESLSEPLDFAKISKLTFAKPDTEAFPSLALAFKAAKTGGAAPCVMNAANEAAVRLFLDGKIAFSSIFKLTKAVFDKLSALPSKSIDDIFSAHEKATSLARELSQFFLI
ncbi:MAG: 1-deoxy-D-xylulose-5-phosphate reductoisomerase [Clostridiales bacterium]|nr:1-deoxy-D-xylulose-5-phosphate reductoisomerase [Clostridiales bacterium]